MPVFNERYFVRECIRRVLAAKLPPGVERELIVVDDGSSDGSGEILCLAQQEQPEVIKVVSHPRNRGKGAAIRTALSVAQGDIFLIQDSDLEYDPKDYPTLLQPIIDGDADAVFGSRFLPYNRRRALLFWHSIANKLVTLFSNIFTNLNLTDVETGYKAVRAPFLRHLPLRCNRFGFEPELAMKLAKQRCRIYEVPIRYTGRSFEEGKKIRAWDGIKAFGVIFWFWLVDDLYGDDEVGRSILNQLSQTPRFNRWMSEAIGEHVGHSALEIGAGIGNMSSLLCYRELYIASDVDDYYCAHLARRFINRPNMRVAKIDVTKAEDFRRISASVDTVICLNVLEHVEDDLGALKNMKHALRKDGGMVLLIPQSPWLYGSLDEALEHKRRYRRRDLLQLMDSAGFKVERIFDFNRISTPAWFINGRLLRRRYFGRVQLKLFDSMVWLLRYVDPFLPWPGQSLIVIASRANGR